MLAFLHTSKAHVETFSRLLNNQLADDDYLQVVEEILLARCIESGEVDEVTINDLKNIVRKLIDQGAETIVCTCSTLSPYFESLQIGKSVQLLRLDRIVATQVARKHKNILVCMVLASTVEASMELFDEVGRSYGATSIAHINERSWQYFVAHETQKYHDCIALEIKNWINTNSGEIVIDSIVLAQASMAGAKSQLQCLDIAVYDVVSYGLSGLLGKQV